MVKSPCIVCGSPSSGSRCPTHQIHRDRNLHTRLIAQIYERDRGRCHICRTPTHPSDASIDHLISLAAGGTDHPSNLALAHKKCNESKGDGTR